MLDINTSNIERENAQGLLNSILDDELLFLLHMHHDLHEIVLSKSLYLLDLHQKVFLPY